jgi:diadenosine tetraphosphate (Ap4A) HIT family hydrolase
VTVAGRGGPTAGGDDRPPPVASPFTRVPEEAWIASNTLAFAIEDRYPASPGHCLLVTRRVVSDWWAATRDERIALLDLADEVRALLAVRHRPDGWNLGVNVGAAAGQTVAHLHLHLIPRYLGDVPDPRGGVRHAVIGRGRYAPDPPG